MGVLKDAAIWQNRDDTCIITEFIISFTLT